MNEMISKLIHVLSHSNYRSGIADSDINVIGVYHQQVRELLEVLRAPTKDMIEAGNYDSEGFNRAGINPDKTVEIFQAMIDSILKEKSNDRR